MDNVLNIRYFSILNSTLNDQNLRNSIRLLTVFGNNGSEVIFVTRDDEVYGYGLNKSGCLGLGTFEQHVRRPQINSTLSGKSLVNIVCGFDHCIGLTSGGQCYSWGQNEFGQLGIGSYEMSHTPQLIKRLAHKAVVQISCGRYHTLALTSDGQVYALSGIKHTFLIRYSNGQVFAWGRNMFGQLGDESYISRFIPKEIQINDSDIVSISCGRMHSLALTDTGRIYVWGINESGQLGRHRECDVHKDREKACAFRPTLIPGYENISFIKAICGPMHSLLLTADGHIYAFGDNSWGQIGNGSEEPQFRPVRINIDVKFKDIITYFENDLSIGISTDDQHYVWGLAKNHKYLVPKLITETTAKSAFDVYAIYAKNKVTFKTFVLNEEIIEPQNDFSHKSSFESDITVKNYSPFGQSFPKLPNKSPNVTNNHILRENYHRINGSLDKQNCVQQTNIVTFNGSNDENYLRFLNKSGSYSQNSVPNDLNYCVSNQSLVSTNISSNPELIIGSIFLSHLRQSFNNPNNYDLRIRSEDKVIYCHKTILEIRSDIFWQILRQKGVQNTSDIDINPDSFSTFFAFIQYIYGLKPEINDQNVRELMSWSKIFKEPELDSLCEQHIRRSENRPNLSNVCSLYEKSIRLGLKDLEKSCIEFASNNWKSIIKSNDFQTMNETLSKRLMLSFFD